MGKANKQGDFFENLQK